MPRAGRRPGGGATAGLGARDSTRAHVAAHARRFVGELAELLRYPSVSSSPAGHPAMQACARWLASHLGRLGAADARVVSTAGHPAIVGRIGRDPALRTVLIYGHYDVQPVEPLSAWQTAPFAPVVRAGYLYGRGASDDKGPLFAHLKAIEVLRALRGALPVNVVFLIDGEEEIGSPHLPALIARLSRYLAADVAVLSDNAVLAPDRPSLTYALRGDLYLELEVAAPVGDLHSGKFGGAAPNALRVMVSALSRLHHADGTVAVPGFERDVEQISARERRYMREVGPSDGALRRETGSLSPVGGGRYSAYERTTIRPALEVAGVTGGYAGPGVKGVIPSRAAAKLDVRLVPHQRPERVHRQIFEHLRRFVPPGLRLRTRERMRATPVIIPRHHPAARAAARAYRRGFGAEPVFVRSGGSIPIVSTFATLLGLPSVLMGFSLPGDRAHAPNERFSLAMFSKGIVTSAAFLEEMARS
jgi:acetylornithine deacetylase/succinyl-diaminopimelate desuccinylase-like protein